ncbi:sensor histidine kinase [Lysinibacillus sphaericus]|uniref:histidine kinase n=1 Tax=Lysinibacillus sphaericus OT4b.31 TaxID=1285586 RepID=R7ZIA7_LYSSH|nr:HAMP domain-containing sensor histidine kinase [Lysinibacillus sphaericus]EON73769.1 sensor protein [Lysinibacillus sphaericus OT4b.31]
MRLFFQDHASVIFLYGISFILLPWLFQSLDDLSTHYYYFIFLVCFFFILWLIGRYYRRRKFYAHLQNATFTKNELHLYEPQALIEKAYSQKLRQMQYLYLSQQQLLEEQAREKQLVLSHFAHQMKTPLSVIQLTIQSRTYEATEQSDYWQTIHNECDKLTFTLNQLLTYERTSNLVADLKIEPIVIKGLVQEVVNDLKDYFIAKEVFPKLSIADSEVIYSDRKWLKIVLYQIVNNSIKYSESETSIQIIYGNATLQIINSGNTILDSEITRVFDLFYTGIKGRTSGEASGIGLYLVKKILATLEHPFTLQSHNQVTTFSIDFSNSTQK